MEKQPKKAGIESHYDDLYSKSENTFGSGEPESLIKELPKYLKGGSVLELGAGQGRNAIWLAREGFHVEARDISSVGIEKIQRIAREENLDIHASKADIREPFEGEYDAITSTYVFHHLTREEALRTIEEIKEHTRILGINLVIVFTKEGDLFGQDTTKDRFYPDPGEIKEIYSDWKCFHTRK